jgi:hypothetical protein
VHTPLDFISAGFVSLKFSGELTRLAAISFTAIFLFTLQRPGGSLFFEPGQFRQFVHELITFDSLPEYPPDALWFYPAFGTSALLWLFASSGFLVKAAHKFDSGLRWFNISKHPLQAIGCVAATVLTIIYLLVAALISFRQG